MKIRRLNLRASSKRIYRDIKERVRKQLWMELLVMVTISLTASAIVFLIVSHAINSSNMGSRDYISYDESRAYARSVMLDRVAQLNGIDNLEESDIEERIEAIIGDYDMDHGYVSDTQTYLVDASGNLLYENGVVESLNLIKVIQKANQSEYSNEINKFVAIYPVILNNEVCYLYNESTLEPFYHKEYTDLGNILGFFAAAAMFILITFRLTRDKISYIEYLCTCLGEISKGNLDYEIDILGEDELAQVAKSITHMEEKIKDQIEAQIQVEQSKNELVTNVAHDLRTPLTSIIGYIGLVKGKGYQTEEEADKYLEIAYNKSEKLKGLIEDLFELTKLHQGGVKLNKTTISLSNLLNQLLEELMPLASDKQIEVEAYIDTNNTVSSVDVGKITRVFENLIENAIKYCPKGETVYVEMRGNEKNVYVAVSNPSDQLPQEEIDKFFDRFYRADKSRNSSAGGSGLGLAIAKNIVELHGGKIKANLNEDLITFKISLPRI